MLVDAQRRVVLSGMGHDVGEQLSEEQTRGGLAIGVDGQVVGTLLMRTRVPEPDAARARFLARFSGAWLIGGGGAMLVALLLSLLLSRSITRPLKELTVATEAMSRGDLAHDIPVRSQDEIGDLTQAFNRMSAELARSQKLRRQMTADIAHELRTPLSLILGHAEALSDGVLPPSAETFDIILDEAQRLSRVVDDLRTLSLSDSGELSLYRVPTPARQLLETAITAHRALAEARGVQLTLSADDDLPDVDVDPDRIAQVLHNLLSNALRYTPQGGSITLSACAQGGQVTFAVADSGSGILQEDLCHVFERFYRGDQARHRADGGTGLGLAIARSIVEMHGGRIWAESSAGSGATFTFQIPV
jgi:two-component system sensor histidine kinase BaeS